MEKRSFEYTYSARRQQEVKAIRSAYLPREEDPLESLHQLEKAGLVQLSQSEVLRRPGGDEPESAVPDPVLTPSQQEVLEVMLPELQRGQGRFLLHGVTGSGKTEVFIRLVRETLR